MSAAGRIARIWRYPVKSLLGERLMRVRVEAGGLAGDRGHALRGADGRIGSGKTSARLRAIDGLLGLAARRRGGNPTFVFPDGRELDAGDPALEGALSALLGEAVRVEPAGREPWFDAAPVHIVTTAALAWLREALPGAAIDERRFRPNLVLEAPGAGAIELGWIGRTLAAGDGVRLRVVEPTERCRMVTLAQQELADDARVLRTIAQRLGGHFGVYAEVLAPGDLAAGDAVAFADSPADGGGR